jgi:uncharacterized protein YacL
MTTTQHPQKANTTRKTITQMAVGAVTGGAAMIAILKLMGFSSDNTIAPDVIIAVGVAMIYGLMAVVVGAGTLVPKAGATLLNVVDAQELRDEKPNLLWSAAGCLCIALLIAALALAVGPDAYLEGQSAAVLVLIAIAGLIVTTWMTWGKADELMRRVSTETSELAFALTAVVFGGWAALVILDRAVMFSPIAFVSGLFGLLLLAMFWVVGKRGMMTS